YLGQLRKVHDEVLTEEVARLPLPALYDRVIGALADFHAAHPGFRPLFYGSPTSPGLASACGVLQQEGVGRVEAMITARRPRRAPGPRRLYATVNVEVIKALLPLSESGDAAFRARVLGEIKELLVAYMAHRLGPEPDRRR